MFFGRYFQAVFIGMGATFLSVLIGDSCVVVEIFLYLFSYWEISIRNLLMEDTYVAFLGGPFSICFLIGDLLLHDGTRRFWVRWQL